MPDPKDDAKPAAGTPAADDARGKSQDGSLARELEDESRPGKGENQAGFLKDRDGDLSGKA